MKDKIIHAIFDDENDVLTVVKDLKDNNIVVSEVYSPFPIHGLDPVLGLKETRLAITAFIYGCIGLCFGALLIYYIMARFALVPFLRWLEVVAARKVGR